MFPFSTITLAREIAQRNPITQAEVRHLRRSEPIRHLITRWATRLFMGFSLGLAALAIVFALTLNMPDGHGRTMGWLVAITLAVHFNVVYRTLNIASRTVVRERTNHRWETLLLTGTTARRFVLGKWWAVISHTWQGFALLAVLRIGTSLSLGTSQTVVFFNSGYDPYLMPIEPSPSTLGQALLAALFVCAFTASNALFTAAAGVTASMFGRSGVFNSAAAIGVRSGMVIAVILGLLSWTLALLFILQGAGINTDSLASPLFTSAESLADNGTFLSAAIADPGSSSLTSSLLSALLALGIYASMTWSLLTYCQRRAWRMGFA